MTSSSPSRPALKRRWLAALTLGAWCCAGPRPAPAAPAAEEPGQTAAVARGAVAEEASAQPAAVAELAVEVLATRPHDPRAFTQGLVFDGRHLLESTGQFGRSELRRVDAASGEVLQRVALDGDHFGEGLALVAAAEPGGEERLIQLTWLAGKALAWTASGFEVRDGFGYQGEGWGLCFDGTSLVMSDGSAELYFRHPRSFEIERVLTVTLNGRPLHRLNELECVDGRVWANVLGAWTLFRIDPDSGEVTATARLTDLLSEEEAAGAGVPNGIAWDGEREIFYITGKNWPKLFEVRIGAAPPAPEGVPGRER